MSRIKRHVLSLAVAFGAVIAAKVYLNRKVAIMEAITGSPAYEEPPADGVTVETQSAPPGRVAQQP